MTRRTGTALLPTYARFPRHVRRRRGLLADRRRRPALPRPRRRDRRRQPRPLPSGAARRRAGAARPALARLEPLLDRADGAPRRAAVRPLRRRAGVLLQLRHRGGRGRDQVGAQGDRPKPGSSRSKARSTAARWARSRSPASRRSARRSSRSCPGVRFATPETLADAVGPDTAAILLEPVQGEGGVRPLAAETLERGARARRRARRAARLRRGADRRRPHRRRSSPGSSSASGPTPSRSRRGSRTGCRSARCSSPTTRRAASCPATTPRPSAATRSRAPRPAPSSTRSTTTCSPTCATIGARFEAAVRRTCAAPGLLLAVELDRPAGPVAHAALEHGLLVGTAGETALRLTPPLTISRRRGRPRRSSCSREVLA